MTKREKLFAPLPLNSIMASVFEGSPVEQRLRESRIWLIWEEAVGKNVATKAHPEGFRDGVLTVAVSAAPWLQQLNFMKREIIGALNQRLGTPLVKDIFLKAGGPAKPGKSPAPDKPRPRILSQAELQQIETIASEAGDCELQDALLNLIRKDRSLSPR